MEIERVINKMFDNFYEMNKKEYDKAIMLEKGDNLFGLLVNTNGVKAISRENVLKKRA